MSSDPEIETAIPQQARAGAAAASRSTSVAVFLAPAGTTTPATEYSERARGFDELQFSATISAAGLKARSYKVPPARRMKRSNQATADAFSRANMDSSLAIECRMLRSKARRRVTAMRDRRPCL